MNDSYQKSSVSLFVGGPADGQRRVTNDEPRVEFAEMCPDNRVRVHHYQRQLFRESNESHGVYFHESIREGDYLRALIQGYVRQGCFF